MRRPQNGPIWLLASIFSAGTFAACSSSDGPADSGAPARKPDSSVPPGEASATGGSPGGFFQPDAGFFHIEAGPAVVTLTPKEAELSVDPSGPAASVQFNATGTSGRDTSFRVTNPSLGTIDEHGLFTASGLIGGEADIQVLEGGRVIASAHLVVNIEQVQNGGSAERADAGVGVGGLGGVGGEGLGASLPSATKKVLDGHAAPDRAFDVLYPYDDTVFPLDVLPPLVQWTSAAPADVDGVRLHISAPYYDYKGYFGRPPSLAADKPFAHHPIPSDVWASATRTAASGTLTVELVAAAKGKALGPVLHHYRVAAAPFRGVVYYQSYGTGLAKNYYGGGGTRTGGATLSIRAGEERPTLVAGKTTPSDDGTGCRVCHSVSARGDLMIVQHGDQYLDSSRYDLKRANAETTPYAPGTVGWVGLTPDGKLGLANSVTVGGPASNVGDTRLYDMATGKAVDAPGLNDFVAQTVLPSFAPDGKHVAFGFKSGPGTPEVGEARGQLVVMDFDSATRTFSGPATLWTPAEGRVVFTTFTPDGNHVIAQRRWGAGDGYSSTDGARSELWWIDLATRTPARLARANGLRADGAAYLPRGLQGHDKDEELNYEPSVSPVAAGGYAWMVFMSRRLYGNIATRDPFDSNAVNKDLGQDPPTKKLWMAAIDLDAKPGVDPSHPAFYIPGQELLGVNSRPFFVMDPCTSDRGTCTTGIDCCSGYCRDGFCRPPPEDQVCSNIDERCETKADCCDGRASCIGGFCAIIVR